MSKDMYVSFVGASELQGDSTDTKHLNEIEVTGFEHRVSQPKSATISTAGALTAARTEHDEMLFTKHVDKATSKLLRACSAGTVYPTVLITFYRAYGGKSSTSTSQTRVDYYKIELSDVVVSSVKTMVTEDELASEVFGLKYGKIVWEYKQHKTDGSATSTGKAGWDLRKNIAV
jgi:type VI secretion system secreted protein Hcp